jgi:hypothetical protein
MTFTLPEKRADFDFPEDSEYHGFEASARLSPVPLGAVFDLAARYDALDTSDQKATTAFLDEWARLTDFRWNLETMPDGAGLFDHLYLSLILFREWSSAVTRVPPPLGLRSNGGSTSRAASTRRPAKASSSRASSRKRSSSKGSAAATPD